MLDMEKPLYPAQRPELLSNMGYALTPFTSGGVSGYTLHRVGHAPVLHSPKEMKDLPAVTMVRSTLNQTKVTSFEFERFVDKFELMDKFGSRGALNAQAMEGTQNLQQHRLKHAGFGARGRPSAAAIAAGTVAEELQVSP